jgi:ubiquitin carboxyl-terminal hydrolase MINDY-1/2
MANLDDSTDNYRIKDIIFFGSARRILLQSKNGPCPLLAICNILLLRNVLKINGDTRYISFGELVAMVSDWLFESNAAASGDGSGAADLQESLSSCLEILPRLNIGLDVNCKFGGTGDFEFTRELAVFDLLDIGLYHGWIVGKEDAAAHGLIGQLSYNQIVERLIAFEEAQQAISSHSAQAAEASSTTDESQQEAWAKTQRAIEEGLVIKEFLDRTASQISYEGLLALHETVRERQLAVFFRNSHFNTMLKYNGKLYLLCALQSLALTL